MLRAKSNSVFEPTMYCRNSLSLGAGEAIACGAVATTMVAGEDKFRSLQGDEDMRRCVGT